MDDFGDEFSDEFEESNGDTPGPGAKGKTSFQNKPYDEAFDVSQDLSMTESYDGRDTVKRGSTEKERKLENDKYDEALDVSQSMDYKNTSMSSPRNESKGSGKKIDKNSGDAGLKSVMNRPFDEALEFSQSGSDDSVDTVGASGNKNTVAPTAASRNVEMKISDHSDVKVSENSTSSARMMPSQSVGGLERPVHDSPQSVPKQQKEVQSSSDDEDDEDGGDESYENLEGAYNPKDYAHLNVTADTRDLFQYIDRYKPQEMELDTELKCFIPEYIPSIGEMDAFIKLPRPDDQQEDLGLKYLDEPTAQQSDPTVLELQLRAMSKKQQYGDVVVRSIENASKDPSAIDKWIQNINDLHRRKPPPQVHYKKNMPEFDSLMEMWTPDFEEILKATQLPSPDLDLSLAEYTRVLCTILDIPTYDNPVESLHLMFTLFMEFRDNPHFQAMMGADQKDIMNGGADVLEIKQGY